MTAPLISLSHIDKTYGAGAAEVRALADVSLTIEAGEFVAIMGPSGSGKSTAMNMIGLLDTPTRGSYRFAGTEVASLSRDQRALVRRRDLGFVFQGFNLLARTSALENVELPLIYQGLPRRARRKLALSALDRVGLAARAHHSPSELSGGQQQRVAIARAIVTRPDVVLAVEPTGNLDTARSTEIMELLTELNRDDGITIVMVTPNPKWRRWRGAASISSTGGSIETPLRRPIMYGEAIRLALQAISRNALRSFLTALGVVIGVAAVIAMVTVGEGSTEQVRNDVRKLGANLLLVRPGQDRRGPGGAGSAAAPLGIRDVDAIEAQVAAVAVAAPISSRQMTVIFGGAIHSTAVMGADSRYMIASDWPIGAGRQFYGSELRSGTAACILGAKVASEPFGAGYPIDAVVRIKTMSCRVIGVLNAKGASTFGSDRDDRVLIPLRAFQRRISGNQDVAMIYAAVRQGQSTDRAKAEIERPMRERRRIGPGEDDDFNVFDMKQITGVLTGVTSVLTNMLSAVAAVSLPVGGIGIMNIMLVSVTGRTREIGIRLAIGATERQVMMQFLIEAITLSLIGGLIGIALGLPWGWPWGRRGRWRWRCRSRPGSGSSRRRSGSRPPWGVAFGCFPARRAARMDPIEALRHQ
jgi:ABC-type lipoprotein export system ATPase subunit/ABC-type antimicrobial peptide transport system permease subunit